ncbi:hypothetical protein OSR40_007255 [Serratia rubidaea]|nr:hypothetical protein [Serratia rubidaea]MDK1703536.1 hypothetical protein [Serratia rubidaea]
MLRSDGNGCSAVAQAWGRKGALATEKKKALQMKGKNTTTPGKR